MFTDQIVIINGCAYNARGSTLLTHPELSNEYVPRTESNLSLNFNTSIIIYSYYASFP